jgi:hypothetical protein
MANQNFTDFTLKTPTSGDFLVGYNADGSDEFRTTVGVLLSSCITSNTTNISLASSINNIIILPQDSYDAIEIKDPNILYFIV